MKGLIKGHDLGEFLEDNSLVLMLETFKSWRSNHFEPILGGFSWDTPRDVVQFVQKF